MNIFCVFLYRKLENFACGFNLRRIARIVCIKQSVIDIKRKFRIERQINGLIIFALAGKFYSKFNDVSAVFLRCEIRDVLIGRQYLLKNSSEAFFLVIKLRLGLA